MARPSSLQLAAFEITPGAALPMRCHVARFPERWLRIIRIQYKANTRRGSDSQWLPTRSLVELLNALDPDILHVSSRLEDEVWIHARTPIDREVVTAAVEAWAATEITNDRPYLDWFEFLGDDPIDWQEVVLDLYAGASRPNGTAWPSAEAFALLPGSLAGLIASQGLPLRDIPRSFILGPVSTSGRRSAVCWPPEIVEDEDGRALWTPRIDFHVQTVPLHRQPRIHAELIVTRFPLQRVAYVPARGDGSPGVTLWLHARDGFLRPAKLPTLVATGASRRPTPEGTWRWTWGPGLTRALARLTAHCYPDPDEVLSFPDRHTATPISAHVVYSGGTTLAPVADDDLDDDTPMTRSVLHPAMPGFQPVDHLELHECLVPILEPLGIGPVSELKPCRSGRAALLHPREMPDQRYVLELWTQSPATRQALMDTLTRKLGFVEAVDRPASESGVLELTGPFALSVVLREAGHLAAGIPRLPKDRATRAKAVSGLAQRVDLIMSAVPACEERRAAIVEIDDPRLYARMKMDDPKPALKKALPLTGRVVQGIHPIKEYRPRPDTKKRKRFLPGTPFAMGDADRAAAAIQDALRQLGRVGVPAPPPGIAGPCELIGLWLEHTDKALVPILVRIAPDGLATAQIIVNDVARELPYADLPSAMVEGQGRLLRKDGVDRKAVISRFLVRGLGVGDVTHDRVVFVRSASFRNTGWDWLQDRHITPDLLVLPGQDPERDNVERLVPSRCPGLRIVRVRERDGAGEVPRGFGVADKDFGRISGLFPCSERVFYGMNPRSDQAQTPKGLTKLDPAQARNAGWPGWNPNPLEVMPVFLQQGDDPEQWAMYTHAMRRAYLHTSIASLLPLPLHLGKLAKEYLV